MRLRLVACLAVASLILPLGLTIEYLAAKSSYDNLTIGSPPAKVAGVLISVTFEPPYTGYPSAGGDAVTIREAVYRSRSGIHSFRILIDENGLVTSKLWQ